MNKEKQQQFCNLFQALVSLCLFVVYYYLVGVLELVDKFCYLGDMLSVDGDADAAVETRIRIGWKKIQAVGSIAYQ